MSVTGRDGLHESALSAGIVELWCNAWASVPMVRVVAAMGKIRAVEIIIEDGDIRPAG